jgi:hypothetical protein
MSRILLKSSGEDVPVDTLWFSRTVLDNQSAAT